MARFETEEHLFTGDVYEVSKDDWSKRQRFTDRDEAEAYYEYLKREEVQDSIARNQAEAVSQNKEIIANQKRLIEAQERNSQIPNRPPFPQATRQILDPEYKEWLQFQKETNPEYLKWKKEKELEAARIKAKREAELAKVAAAKAADEARKKAQQEEAEKKRLNELQENQKKIAPLELEFLNKKKLTWEQRVQIAKYSNNKIIINKLKYDNSKKVLDTLLLNPFITNDVISTIHKRQQVATKNKELKNIGKIEQKQENKGGCWGIIVLLIVIIIGLVVKSILL